MVPPPGAARAPQACCARSRSLGACQCRWCGAALPLGRMPSAQERHETSPAVRRAALAARLLAPDLDDEVDAQVIAAVGALAADGRAFHAAELTGLSRRSAIAIRWSLERLERRGAVRRAERVRVRTSRWRQLWTLEAANDDARAKGAGVIPGLQPRSV